MDKVHGSVGTSVFVCVYFHVCALFMVSMDGNILATALISFSMLNFPCQCFFEGECEECRPRLWLLGTLGANLQLVFASAGYLELGLEFAVVCMYFSTTCSLDYLPGAACLHRCSLCYTAFAVSRLSFQAFLFACTTPSSP